jgi:hypothetical protein
MKIQYLSGDATDPNLGQDMQTMHIIIHCCNNKGAWGSGFVLALNKLSPEPKRMYKKMAPYKLGDIAFVKIKSNLLVANIIGQDGYGRNHRKYVKYWAIKDACEELVKLLPSLAPPRPYPLSDCQHPYNVHIHAPRLGAGLAGGEWEEIEMILQRVFCDQNIPVTIYDLPR